ncbi:TVP38/TMEM64 family protein [Bacillus salacetis]|uniref:TVP38/TMEM64 family protein n=1 Tax=Bacillus salacetis TaxID=2315464 RepID=UPI003BA34AC5
MELILSNWLGYSNQYFAIVISILLNITISILGIVPSAFLTAANITVFGFEFGMLISFIGEASGAVISFLLYQTGIKKVIGTRTKPIHQKHLTRLQKSKGAEAFFLVLALRLLPFVPSGIVTLSGAFSKMGLMNFAFASTLGKVPSILIEAYAIQEVLFLSWKGKVILSLTSLVIIIALLKRYSKNKQDSFKR